jgi:hypothetical protein
MPSNGALGTGGEPGAGDAGDGGGVPGAGDGGGVPGAGDAGGEPSASGEPGGGGVAPVRVGLGTVLGGGPGGVGRGGGAVAANLTADPGGWLLRLLLAVDAPRLAVLVPARHPDLAGGAIGRELAGLVAAKYRLDVAGGTPDGRHAVVVADRVEAGGLSGPDRVVRWLLDRPHATVAGGWRDALVKTARRTGAELTRAGARDLVRTAVPDPDLLDERVIDLPRHRLAALVAAARDQVAQVSL